MKAVALLFSSLIAGVVGQGIPQNYFPVQPLVDNSTFANLDYVRVTHQFVDWFPNFQTSQLQGSIVLDLQVIQQTMYVQLDVANCTVTDVQLMPPGSAMSATMNKGVIPVTDSPLEFEVVSPNPLVGDVLVIYLAQNYTMGQVFSLNVIYSTNSDSEGVNWVPSAYTANGNYAMMYTYSYTILGRQIAPQMDSPSNRITWGGCITAPTQLTSFMSANQTGIYQSVLNQYKTCFFQSIPAPNYLMAAIVGDLEQQAPAGATNVTIIAESSTMASALSTFSNLQTLINVCQHWMQTPYIWGSYNLVVMPPNYPEGGMSNPMLAYVSPTTMAGGSGQEYVIVREMVQSWTGNQVTPSNWEDVWMNEGITTFAERMVIAQAYSYYQAQTSAFVGNTSLYEATSIIGYRQNTWLSLHPVLQGNNPNDAMTIVPFEKGFQLMTYVSDLIGESLAQDFITYWITNHNLHSVNAFTGFRKTFSQFVESVIPTVQPFTPSDVNNVLATMMYDDWIYVKGPAPSVLGTPYNNADVFAAQDLANEYILAAGTGFVPGYMNYFDWYPAQQVVFVQTLILSTDTDLAIIQAIDTDLNISSTNDPEVKQRWLSLGCYYGYNVAISVAETWVSEMGRNKYLQAIYTAMAQSPDQPTALNTAKNWYFTNYDFYAPTTQLLIQSILDL